MSHARSTAGAVGQKVGALATRLDRFGASIPTGTGTWSSRPTSITTMGLCSGGYGLGRFKSDRKGARPSTMPNINDEGFTFAPNSEWAANGKPVFWADDRENAGHTIGRATLPCGRSHRYFRACYRAPAAPVTGPRGNRHPTWRTLAEPDVGRRGFLNRLDAHDRALFARLIRNRDAPPRRWLWTALSHLGGARASMTLCVLPFIARVVPFRIAWKALLAVGVSHAVVQIIKRCAARERPAKRLSLTALIHEPDCFSFPSGHSCAAMAVAASFAMALPAASLPLLCAAMLVGLSRVMLGVHYPGDVVAGQGIALVTTYAILAPY